MAADVVHAARVGEVEELASKQRLHLERNGKQIFTLHTVHVQTRIGSEAFPCLASLSSSSILNDPF